MLFTIQCADDSWIWVQTVWKDHQITEFAASSQSVRRMQFTIQYANDSWSFLQHANLNFEHANTAIFQTLLTWEMNWSDKHISSFQSALSHHSISLQLYGLVWKRCGSRKSQLIQIYTVNLKFKWGPKIISRQKMSPLDTSSRMC